MIEGVIQGVIQFHGIAVVGILGLAALALGCWQNAWSECIECGRKRAYCECGKGDVRRPDWSDKKWRKK